MAKQCRLKKSRAVRAAVPVLRAQWTTKAILLPPLKG